MRILKIISQHRRDFSAIFVCEHCEAQETINNCYDDAYYHTKVIPELKCKKCGKTASDDYRPLTTKYPEGMQI